MSAFYVFVVLLSVGGFGWACWRAGVERGLSICESNVTLALRLAAADKAEVARQARVEMGCELLGALGENWRHPKSAPHVEIDLRDPPEVKP